MRLSFSFLPVVSAALIAACAAPNPAPEAPPPAPVAVPAKAPPPSPVFEVPEPPPALAAPFPLASNAELEPLPTQAEDLWTRIRRGYAMPDIDDPLVAKWEQWYSSRPDYVARMVDRSRRYLYYIVVEVEERRMPLEIALLPMVESAFNPNALSVSRASGIWQFMPSTGTHYGLKQNFWFDSRRDVVAATEGALTYLQKLHGDFNDWQLALAAYNWGEGNVGRAVAKNQAAQQPADYANLKMPDETRNYLPKLQALKNIVRDPEKFGLELGDIPDAPYFAVIRSNRKIDVKVAAALAEMSLEEFRYLNPQHNRPVIAGADEYTILLPIDKAELFAAKLNLADQPLVSWQAYRMRNAETLPQVAAKFGMSVDALRAVNGIGAKAKVATGHALLVPAQGPAEAAADTLSNVVFTTVPQGRTFYYRVNRGDTLGNIASRYAVSAQDLRRWNGIAGSGGVTAGQSLRITSDLAPSTGTTKRAGSRKPSTVAVKPKPKPKPKVGKPAAKTGAGAPTAKAKGAAGS
ncbi:MAG: transglycosylase SLT domain-containing protein [Betaproteobacteria bacterium]